MKHTSKKILYIAVPLLFVVSIVVVLELTNVTHFFHKTAYTPPSSGSQYTKGEAQSTPQTTKAANQSTTNDTTVSDKSSVGTNETVLLAPSGDFVSNHHPNLSGSPAPNTMSSVCTTTPGASCSITFTDGSVTKSLAAEVVDSGGSAYWNWKLQTVGLTAGTWHIKAVATLAGSTESSSDAMDLVVSQ